MPLNALALDPEQIDDAGVREYMEELIAQMQAEALKYTINVKLAADVDTDEWTKRVKAALGTLAGEDGVVTATDIRDADITARVEAENASQTRGYMSAEAQAWNDLADAAGEYHTDVEGLIPLLEQYGYLTKSTTEELEDETEAAGELTDALSTLGDFYDLLTKAQSEMNAGGLSSGTAQSIIKELEEAGEDYTKYLTEENGVLRLNTEAWDAYIAAKREAAEQAGDVGNQGLTDALNKCYGVDLDRWSELAKGKWQVDKGDEANSDAFLRTWDLRHGAENDQQHHEQLKAHRV